MYLATFVNLHIQRANKQIKLDEWKRGITFQIEDSIGIGDNYSQVGIKVGIYENRFVRRRIFRFHFRCSIGINFFAMSFHHDCAGNHDGRKREIWRSEEK